MARLWIILRKRNKIWKNITVDTEGDDLSSAQEAVTRASCQLDIPRPIWLENNENEIQAFGRTHFARDHFIESIDFDRMEIEFLSDKPKALGPDDGYSLA